MSQTENKDWFTDWTENSTGMSDEVLLGALNSENNPDVLKMAFIVRKDLKMSVGKVATQCSRASGAISILLDSLELVELHMLKFDWMIQGMIKIVLRVDSEDEFNGVLENTKINKLPFYVVKDAGKTQISSGTSTVLAIGPATKQQLDPIVGNLKLY